jgi:hypothetical protein
MRFWSLALVLPLCLVACGDKSAVSLSVIFDQVTVTAQNGLLGASLGGGFTLHFVLGPEASGSTTVTLGNFTLQTAAGAAVVGPLALSSGGATFPLVVDKGSTQTVTFTLMPTTLTLAEHDALCAGQVQIVGSVMDTLKGGTDPVESADISPTCS